MLASHSRGNCSTWLLLVERQRGGEVVEVDCNTNRMVAD
jgi:hypothetical protein